MGFSIQPPPPQAITATVDNTQLVLDIPVSPTPVALIEGEQEAIIPADPTRQIGLVDAISNTSATAIVYVAHGRAATASVWDYTVYPNSSINDKKLGTESVSAIAIGANSTINITYRKMVEV